MTRQQSVTGGVGGRLRCAREQRGLSLHHLAGRTKLSISVLQAIERNEFARLPGGMFRKAYIRTLAREVALDPDEMCADYCAQFEPPPSPPAVPDHEAAPARESVQRWLLDPRLSMVGLATLAVVWFSMQPGPVRPHVPIDDEANASVASPMPRALRTSTADGALGATPRVIAVPATSLPLRVELTANGSCWVAAETDGVRSMYRLVEPGERLMLEAQRVISLRLGNAGGMTISINEGPSRSLGRDGEVVELEVTPDDVKRLGDLAAEI